MKKIIELIEFYSAAFFKSPKKKTRWFNIAWCALLILIGAVLWAKVLNFGSIPFDFHDWAEINAPRLAFVKDAVEHGVLPLHMNDDTALRSLTDRYLCIPDAIISPQMYFLKYMTIGEYVLFNTLLFYFIGVWGLIKLKQRFKLSPFSFSFLFLMYTLNGHIMAHYSVGHITWVGSFLFSWFIYLVFDLLDGDRSWAWIAKMSFLLFVIYLQGSFHQFIWALLFLGFLAISDWKNFWTIVKAGVVITAINLFRILPPTLLIRSFDDDFLSGYPTLLDMIKSMVLIIPPEKSYSVRSLLSILGWWEYDMYIGLAGFTFILVFGIGFWVRKMRRNKGFYPQLFLPTLALILLSLGRIYNIMSIIPIPLFSSERASIRIILLPLMFLMVIASVYCQKWLNKRDIKAELVTQIIGYSSLLILVHDLWQHLKLWQVGNVFLVFPETPIDLSIKVVANHIDPEYTNMLSISAAISLFAMLILLILVYAERRKSIK